MTVIVLLVIAVVGYIAYSLYQKKKELVQPPPPPYVVEVARPPENPFSKYAGLTLYDVVLKMGRGLSDFELTLAKDAGVVLNEAPPIVSIGVDSSGFDLVEGVRSVNPFVAGQAQSFTYTIRPGTKKAQIRVVTHSAGEFHNVVDSTDAPDGFTDRKTFYAGTLQLHIANLPVVPGTYTYTVALMDLIGRDIAVQFNQW